MSSYNIIMALTNAGYSTIEENGIVMVLYEGKYNKSLITEVGSFALEHGYNGSIGVRKKKINE